MPYIPQKDRADLMFAKKEADKPGELNFLLSLVISNYIKRKGISYTALNEVIGVLSCLSLELYRRMVAVYEDKKMTENGDVFEDVMDEIFGPEKANRKVGFVQEDEYA